MRWPTRVVRWSPVTPVFLLSLVVAWPTAAFAQLPAGWTSTDVGSVGIAGSASESSGTWTVQGSGSDIWGTSDSFQFVHKTMGDSGRVEARISDLQNTNPFAKAGVMVRAGLGPDAATVILNVRPDLGTGFAGVEFMVRSQTGSSMVFLSGANGAQRPITLRLTWQGNRVVAQVFLDPGDNGITVGAANMTMPSTTEAGLAVTSHDQTQLTTARVTGLTAVAVPPAGWHSSDVGAVGQAGSAVESNGVWTINGAGGDIWGAADAFHYLWRGESGGGPQLRVRIDDLKATHAFAKAGLMVRQTLDADSPAVVLDVTPSGNVEFMVRDTKGGEMRYLGGATVTFPVWLSLSNASAPQGTGYFASVSQDGVHFTGLLTDPAPFGSSVAAYYIGVAVTSHDTAQLTTAHIRGFSEGIAPTQIGNTGIIGNSVDDLVGVSTVQAAGADIWGSADSFQFLDSGTGANSVRAIRVLGITNTNPFAKAGLVFRDGTDPSAASVVLDIKPDGGVEFMARLCGGCETTYLGGATMTFPAYLVLSPGTSDAPNTFTAKVSQTNPFQSSSGTTTIGTVTVPMSNRIGGVAVTSHDPSQVTTVTFDNAFIF